MALRIGVNAHLLSFGATYRAAGISRYILNLLRHLPGALGADEATAFLGDGPPPPWLASGRLHLGLTRLPTARPAVRTLWEQALAPLECRRHRLDVFHSPAYVQPLLCPCRSVVTVHDLSFHLFPGAFRPGNRLYLAALTRLAVRQADRVIAVSASTRDDLVRLLGVPPAKVVVVHHGVEPEFRPLGRGPAAAGDDGAARLAELRRRRGLPDEYVLFLGTLEPRKNLPTLLQAYALARREHGVRLPLVLGGAPGWGYAEVYRLLAELGLASDVRRPGFVPLDELPLWYNGASLFVYPSRYEGFGMPVLEAMACGTPVVTSRASSLPEVAGGAAELVDPDDVAGLAATLARLLGDEERRAELRRRGLARAARFSWDETARQTVAVYRACRG